MNLFAQGIKQRPGPYGRIRATAGELFECGSYHTYILVRMYVVATRRAAMVRRTKDEAEQTRRQILAAARRVFHERGVGNTSLEQIAQAAGVTRGAIYWHFANKEDLFKAMCQEVTIPFVDRMDYTLLVDPSSTPLERLRNFLRQITQTVQQDECLRCTMEILNFKCEYVGDMEKDLADYIERNEEFLGKLERTYQSARRARQLRADLPPRLAAMETLVFLTGLLRLRLLGVPALQRPSDVRAMIDAHVDSRRCPEREAAAP